MLVFSIYSSWCVWSLTAGPLSLTCSNTPTPSWLSFYNHANCIYNHSCLSLSHKLPLPTPCRDFSFEILRAVGKKNRMMNYILGWPTKCSREPKKNKFHSHELLILWEKYSPNYDRKLTDILYMKCQIAISKFPCNSE